MNSDQPRSRRFVLTLSREQFFPEYEPRYELDTGDLAVIRHALNCYAEQSSFPQHIAPLRKLSDLITESLKP